MKCLIDCPDKLSDEDIDRAFSTSTILSSIIKDYKAPEVNSRSGAYLMSQIVNNNPTDVEFHFSEFDLINYIKDIKNDIPVSISLSLGETKRIKIKLTF